MARSKTAQPKHSLRKIAVVVATAVSGMSVYAQAAVEPKEDTITVTAAPAPQESAWGPAATIAARQSATGTKTDTPIQKVPQSISVVTAGNDSNLLIVFYVQIMPDDFVMQLHRF